MRAAGPDGSRPRPRAAIDLYWLPLGAGSWLVAWNGRVYERVVAAMQHRPRADLYHSALVVTLDAARWVIEMTPSPPGRGRDRGVVAEGAVGMRTTRAVRVSEERSACRRLLDAIGDVPTPVWGRDERGTGEMWSSNSTSSWALERAGIDASLLHPPAGGRAPGWHAGIAVARRSSLLTP